MNPFVPGQCVEVLLCGWGWWRARVVETGFLTGQAVCRVVFADGAEGIYRPDQMWPYEPLGGLFAGLDEEDDNEERNDAE